MKLQNTWNITKYMKSASNFNAHHKNHLQILLQIYIFVHNKIVISFYLSKNVTILQNVQVQYDQGVLIYLNSNSLVWYPI